MSNKNKIIIVILVLLSILFVYFIKNKEENINIENNMDNVEMELDFETNDVLDINKLKKYKLPIIIQFASEDCGVCKIMKPYLEKLNKDLRGKAIIKYIDIWKNPRLGNGYYFSYVPTQIFVDSKGNNFIPSNELSDIHFEFKKNRNGYDYTAHTGLLTEDEIFKILKEMGYNE